MEEDWFENTFGNGLYKKRKPRAKSIEEIHDLWIRSSNRALKQQEYLSSVINEIIEKIVKNSKGEYVVYFKVSDLYYSYNISYNREFKSHGYSQNLLHFSNDLATSRQEKLESILSNDLAFKLGEKLRLAERNRSNKSYMVKSKMHEIIENKLRKHFKETNTLPKDITIVEIGNKKYYAKVDSQHRYTYLTFKLVGNVDETDTIKIN